MSLKNLSFILSLDDRIKDRLVEVKQQLADVAGTTAEAAVNVTVNGQDGLKAAAKSSNAAVASIGTAATSAGKSVSSASSLAGSAMSALSGVGKSVVGVVGEIETAGASAFKAVGTCVKDTTAAIGELMGSLATMAAGGAIAGLSWLSAAKTKLYTDEVYRAIDANKSYGISSKDLQTHIAKSLAQAPGWTTESAATEETYNMLAYGGKNLKKGKAGLEQTENISKDYFANQEMMGKAGFSGADDLVRAISRKTIRPDQMKALNSIGLTNLDLSSPAKALAKLSKQGATVKIQTELDKRPWIEAQNSVDDLTKSVGTALIPTMDRLAKVFSGVVQWITKTPNMAWLIGMGALVVTATGALSMLYAVFSPLITLLTGATMRTYALKAAQLAWSLATKAVAAAQWILNAAMDANPFGIAILALVAIGAGLYLVEQKTHIFSNALKYLANTDMGKGILKWIGDVKNSLGNVWGKITGAGAAKVLMELAGGDIATPLKSILGYISHFLEGNPVLNKWFKDAMAIWEKIAGLFKLAQDFTKNPIGEIHDAWTNFWTGIQKGLDNIKSPAWLANFKWPTDADLTKKARDFAIWITGLFAGIHLPDWSKLFPGLPDWHNLIPKLPDCSGIFDGLKLSIQGFIDWINKFTSQIGITLPGGSTPAQAPPEAPPTTPNGPAIWAPGNNGFGGNWVDPKDQSKVIFTSVTDKINNDYRMSHLGTDSNRGDNVGIGSNYGVPGTSYQPIAGTTEAQDTATEGLKDTTPYKTTFDTKNEALASAYTNRQDQSVKGQSKFVDAASWESNSNKGYADGGVVKSSGWLPGPVHTGEIVPAAKVEKLRDSSGGKGENMPGTPVGTAKALLGMAQNAYNSAFNNQPAPSSHTDAVLHNLGAKGYTGGGTVKSSEIVPAAKVEKLRDSSAGKGGDVHNHFNGPLVHVDKIEDSADIDKLVFRLRSELENLQKRNIGYYRGGTTGR